MDEETRWNVLALRNHAPFVWVPPLRIQGCAWNVDRKLWSLRVWAAEDVAYNLAEDHPRSHPVWPLDEIMIELRQMVKR